MNKWSAMPLAILGLSITEVTWNTARTCVRTPDYLDGDHHRHQSSWTEADADDVIAAVRKVAAAYYR